MLLTEQFRKKVTISYCALFFILGLYKFSEGQFLSQFQPAFFAVRPDAVSWLFMQSGLHVYLINHPHLLIVADALFYTAPFLLLLSYFFYRRLFSVAAIYMLIINWMYIHVYVMYPTNSVEGHICWLLFPVVFIPVNLKTFFLLFKGLRYFFLFFFCSAGLWKLRQMGVFSINEMSGILLMQHKELLVADGYDWWIQLINWLIQHPTYSYWIYLAAVVAELFFVVGFFTTRFDIFLAIVFVVFLIADYLLMRIPYLDVAPFLLTLIYVKRIQFKNAKF